jgi:hypothetical protein
MKIRKASGKFLERVDEAGKIAGQVGLLFRHGRRIVDHEEQVELHRRVCLDHARGRSRRALRGLSRPARVAVRLDVPPSRETRIDVLPSQPTQRRTKWPNQLSRMATFVLKIPQNRRERAIPCPVA